jgi:GNAT superfamily N-acetyltransferase
MMQPLIRPLSPSDFAEWLVLWRAYQIFYGAAIPEEVTRVSFSRMLDPAEPMFGALATDGSRALGLVHWIFHRSNWTAGDYCYLQDLYVDADHRGAGLGRALIGHVHGHAAAAGCSRVYWLTHETNSTAMRLYDAVAERTGFIQYKVPIQGA